MGWERKRGKLEEFNAALRGDAAAFDTIVGPRRAAAGRPVRDHARQRHAAPARLGPAARRHARPPAEPARATTSSSAG